LGLGVSSAHVRSRAYEDSAVAVCHSAGVTTTAKTLGVAGQLVYSYPTTRFISAAAEARLWKGPTVESARRLHFTRIRSRRRDTLLSAVLGLAF